MAVIQWILRGSAVMLTVAMFAFLAIACNGGGGGDKTQQVDDTTEANGGDDAELQNLAALAIQAAEGITASVTYKVTSEANGETFNGEWVVIQRPPDSRVEFSSEEEEVRTIIIHTGGKTYLCTSSGDEESCLTTGADDAGGPSSALFDLPQEITNDVSAVGLVDSSEREIAGLDATCFRVDGALSGLGKGEVCFSDDGLLLYLQGDVDGANSTFEATTVSTDVTDTDFEPPYKIEPFELPEFYTPTPP